MSSKQVFKNIHCGANSVVTYGTNNKVTVSSTGSKITSSGVITKGHGNIVTVSTNNMYGTVHDEYFSAVDVERSDTGDKRSCMENNESSTFQYDTDFLKLYGSMNLCGRSFTSLEIFEIDPIHEIKLKGQCDSISSTLGDISISDSVTHIATGSGNVIIDTSVHENIFSDTGVIIIDGHVHGKTSTKTGVISKSN